MGKVIIITTPTATHPGQAIVASTDQSDVRPGPNLLVEFTSGLPNMNLGDVVECTITSPIECKLTKVVGPSTWAQGNVTRTDFFIMGAGPYSEFQIKVLCDPNPFDVKLGDKLPFKDSNKEAKVGDTVGCIPTTPSGLCEVMHVLIPA